MDSGSDHATPPDTVPTHMVRQEYIDGWKAIGLSEDEVHRLLAAGRRRLALEVLAGGGPTDLDSLAEEIVRLEGHDDATENSIRRMKVDLYHRHLPLMADLGAVEYDRRTGRVEARRVEVEVS